ncbi:GtrA family protein [Streptomyces sp. NPDC058867]|uniref:GtrA family protein n=1 Tax=unclassified Streptomyces TaxID=2593676 RepID=UPI003686D6A2
MTSPLASFARFVVCGGGVGLVSGATVPLLADSMPWALANALVTVASTLLCTELHALFTFGTGRRPGLRGHLRSAASAAVAYGATSAAVLLLHLLKPSPTLLWEQTVYLTAAALAGIGRFLVLRLLVFAPEADRGPRGREVQARAATTDADQPELVGLAPPHPGFRVPCPHGHAISSPGREKHERPRISPGPLADVHSAGFEPATF